MIHLGDITKISGYDVPVVDCVIGGSPCQDLSLAGKRAGFSGTRSILFMDQIRIIKELRNADIQRGRTGDAVRPRFMAWENVVGAFSSNKGKDFRAVLEETIRIAEPEAPSVPLPPKGKWPMADAYYGDGWSVAYRVFDAQFWGVPQRRRRIALVADFGGHAAPEILFVRQSVCGDIAESGAPGKETPAGIGDRPAEAGSQCLTPWDVQSRRIHPEDGTWPALYAGEGGGHGYIATGFSGAALYENHGQDSRITGPLNTAPTVSTKYGTGGNNTPLVMATGQSRSEILPNLCPTLNCNHEQPIVGTFQNTGQGWWTEGPIGATTRTPCGGDSTKANLVVSRKNKTIRRLTPLECERLQGYPDGWTDIGPWTDSKGKRHKESSDRSRYAALGNSIALPPWKWVLKRLCSQYERDATMVSLFDGIGGFPLIWEQLNGPGTCLWASEIEDFPIAVTKRHFGGQETAGKDRKT